MSVNLFSRQQTIVHKVIPCFQVPAMASDKKASHGVWNDMNHVNMYLVNICIALWDVNMAEIEIWPHIPQNNNCYSICVTPSKNVIKYVVLYE